MKKFSLLVVFMLLLVGCQEKANALTLDQAQEIALKEVDGTVLKAIEENDDGVNYYEFVIANENEKYEIEVNAQNGEILKTEKDDDYVPSNQTSSQPGQGEVKLTTEEAQKIALDKVGGGTLQRCELDYDDDTNITVYEIEIINGKQEFDLDIDANSGEILSYEVDD